MTTYHVSKPDETIRKMVNATFPDYKGKSFKLSTSIPSRLDSYWDGGSRDYYSFYELATGKTFNVHSNHPMFEANQPRLINGLPNGIVIVERSYFCGKDMGITIYANDVDLTPMLPKPSDITENERIVLVATRSLKNSYAGQKHVRFHASKRQFGISREQWIEAQQTLISKGMLRKNKSITPDGQNAVANDYTQII